MLHLISNKFVFIDLRGKVYNIVDFLLLLLLLLLLLKYVNFVYKKK